MSDEARESHSGRRGKKFRVIDGGPCGPSPIGRTMPHSVEAEEYLLCCVLLDGVAMLGRCRQGGVTPEAFYLSGHRTIYAKLLEMEKKNLVIDVSTLAQELRDAPAREGQPAMGESVLESIGGYQFLMQVSSRVPTTAQAGYWIDKVCELALLRAEIRDATACVEACYHYTGGIERLLGDWALTFQRRADWAARRRQKSLRERMEGRLALALRAAAGDVDRSRWIYTGLAGLDAEISPWDVRREHWLNIVAGPPSGGKSSFMRHIALHNVVRAEKRFAIFLLETGLAWTESAAATLAQVPLNPILEGTAPRDHVARYEEWYRHLVDLADDRLFVFDDIYFVEDIERKAREIDRMLRERETAAGVPEEKVHGLDGVVVDYLQIVPTREPFRGNREQIVAHVSMALKKLAKSMDVPFFVGAQINRSAQASGGAPTLAALRESGAIEQDADSVVFVFTPAENKAGIKQDGNNAIDEMEIVQRKRRNGVKDVAHGLLFYKAQTRYEEPPGCSVMKPGMPKPANGYKREGGR